MARSGNKEIQALNLNPDARKLLKEQAGRAGVPISTYIERIILEKEWEYRHDINPEGGAST